jgi:CheY-like chemotaxis protein
MSMLHAETLPERRRVVIATGEPAIARIISHKLGREGHEVVVVANAQALDDILAGGDADVALVDLLLAGATADRIAERVTAGWLAIVDSQQPHLAERAMRAGAAGLVRTPFKPTVVAGQVATLLTMVQR